MQKKRLLIRKMRQFSVKYGRHEVCGFQTRVPPQTARRPYLQASFDELQGLSFGVRQPYFFVPGLTPFRVANVLTSRNSISETRLRPAAPNDAGSGPENPSTLPLSEAIIVGQNSQLPFAAPSFHPPELFETLSARQEYQRANEKSDIDDYRYANDHPTHNRARLQVIDNV